MFLGIDLGTSEVKVVLTDERGGLVASSGLPLEAVRPQARWSEQDPEAWWRATLGAVGRLRDVHPAELAAVRGIGLSGQMHGATLLGDSDQVLRPAMLWNDVRSATECDELLARVPEAVAITGNLVMPSFTAPKLLWVAKHEPEVFARTRAVLLPKDFLRLRLSGEKVSDMSDAAGTLWLDVARRDWSDAMLGACGLSRAHVPRLVEGSAAAGQLLPGLAAAWGIHHPVVIAGGGGDPAASAVGVGAVAPGSGFASLGTSGVLFVVNDRFLPNPSRAVHAFCHALPRRWHQMSVMLSAVSASHWVTRLVGARNAEELLAELEKLDRGARARAPIFLPYLSGERTPHNDPAALGVFYGLTHDTEREELVHAVLEGVAFGLADGIEALKAAGTEVRSLALVGGGARTPYWAQLISDVLGVALEVHEGGEAEAALGAARLAQLACGGSEDVVCARPPVMRVFEPAGEAQALHGERLARYRQLYGALAPIWRHVH